MDLFSGEIVYVLCSQSENGVVTTLLDNGADANQTSFDDPSSLYVDSIREEFLLTPMHCALRRGNLTLVQLLRDRGIEADAHDEGLDGFLCPDPPLSRLAARRGTEPALLFLLHLDVLFVGRLAVVF